MAWNYVAQAGLERKILTLAVQLYPASHPPASDLPFLIYLTYALLSGTVNASC